MAQRLGFRIQGLGFRLRRLLLEAERFGFRVSRFANHKTAKHCKTQNRKTLNPEERLEEECLGFRVQFFDVCGL